MQVRSLFQKWRPFFFRIALPSIFTISLCLVSIFAVILPSFEESMMTGKRQMIKELTNSAWSIIDQFSSRAQAGDFSEKEAQKRALSSINALRYGADQRDYFWVTDLTPRMLMHPFRSDLNGQDLSNYKDPEGKRLFVESADLARSSGDGYLSYIWEDKDDPEKMVPKLSYVRFFEPWGWVIGTGVYLEDVEIEIRLLTGRLLKGSLFITAIISMLLIMMTRESLKIESRRQLQEEKLQESHEKYRKLVEASREGLMMILDNDIVYSNQPFRDLTGFSGVELSGMKLVDLLSDPSGHETPAELIYRLFEVESSSESEVLIEKNDGSKFDVLISVSPIVLGGRSGHTVTVSDLARQKEAEGALGRSKEQYRHLIENINVGVFRTTVGKNSRFIDANPACITIFGLRSQEELFAIDSWDLFLDVSERNDFLRKFSRDGLIKHHPIRLHHRDGKLVTVSISAVLVRDEAGKPLYCDGFIEDITDSFSVEAEQKRLIGELQSALLFLHEPISRAVPEQNLLFCKLSTPAITASKLMTEAGTGALLVQSSEDARPIGIVTDHDIRNRLVGPDLPGKTPVSQIMSAPLVWIHEDALMFEGLLAMLDHDIGHIVVKDINGRPTKVVGAAQFLRNQKYPLAVLLRDINNAETPEQLLTVKERLPLIIRSSFSSGADPQNMTRIVSAAAEAVMKKCILFAIAELGKPPADFVFMTLGSVGREEQTLVTDQDNALVYRDVSEDLREETAHYFLKMGEMVCTWLDGAGYTFCEGEIMAMNPRWCQPFSVWQDYFKQWISTSEPTDLLETKIFFDFRGVYGDLKIVEELRNRLHQLVVNKPMFLYHLVNNCLQFKPPLGLFKNIVVESTGEHREKFSIKKAMTPIVDLARIYALKHGINETSTFGRLAKLEAGGHLPSASYRELKTVYQHLLEQRFKHQILALEEGAVPDNHINPKSLTEMEQAILREAMSQISSFQTKMSFDHTGSA